MGMFNGGLRRFGKTRMISERYEEVGGVRGFRRYGRDGKGSDGVGGMWEPRW